MSKTFKAPWRKASKTNAGDNSGNHSPEKDPKDGFFKKFLTKDNAKKTFALLSSSALVVGGLALLDPKLDAPGIISGTSDIGDTPSAALNISFENKTPAETKAMMKNMTVDEIIDAMPLRDKVSQLFVPYTNDFTQTNTNAVSSGGSSMKVSSLSSTAKTNMANYPFGGVCYFAGDIDSKTQLKSLSDDFQAQSKYGMLIAIDEEGGGVQRLQSPYGTTVPNMYSFKDAGTATAKSNAQTLAQNCVNVGVNWDFAPVADTKSNPNNTVIGNRAYSDTFTGVADLIPSAIEGFHSKNVAATIKHFPGHGDTATDSHLGTPLVNKTISTMKTQELVPFKAGIDAGADAIMLGHLAYLLPNGQSSSTQNPPLIATNSSEIITDLIRTEYKFNGIIVTDGMRMGGLTAVYNPSHKNGNAWDGSYTAEKSVYNWSQSYNGYVTAALDFFKAGGDMFLLCGDPYGAVRAIETEVAAGNITEDRVDESLRRIFNQKRKYGVIDALQEPDAEATYISSDGKTTARGTLAEMWERATADACDGKECSILLNKDVTADANGSFGTGSNINSNGDLVVPANKKIILDLRGHTLNKNLSQSVTGDKHLFSIVGNSASNDTKVTVQDSSANHSGKIIGCAGGEGTVANCSGAGSKFIMDGGTLTQNYGTSLVKGTSSSIFRLGLHMVSPNTNNAGTVRIENNNVTKAIDMSGTMYLLGNVTVRNNGGANIYMDGTASTITVQNEGPLAGVGTIGLTVSDTRRASSFNIGTKSAYNSPTDVAPATTIEENAAAFFYDNEKFVVAGTGNTLYLEAIDGAVRFTRASDHQQFAGTWDEMYNAHNNEAGRYTFLLNTTINATKAYNFKVDTVVDLNGKNVIVNSTAGHFLGISNARLELTDSHIGNQISDTVVDASAGTDSEWDASTKRLRYIEDQFVDGHIESHEKVIDLSMVGGIEFHSTYGTIPGYPDPDGLISTVRRTDVSSNKTTATIVINGIRYSNSDARLAFLEYDTNITVDSGYFIDNTVTAHGLIWAIRNDASVTVNNGIFAGNNMTGTSEVKKDNNNIVPNIAGDESVVSLANWGGVGPTCSITGGVFTGNKSIGNGAAVNSASNNNEYNTSSSAGMFITGGTFCHNSAFGTDLAGNMGRGGAIYCERPSSDSRTDTNSISNATISNNKALNGGGIYMKADTTKLKLSGNTYVMDNLAVDEGAAGGIYAVGKDKALSIQDNIYVKNNKRDTSKKPSSYMAMSVMAAADTPSTAKDSDILTQEPNGGTIHVIGLSGPITSPVESIGFDLTNAAIGTKVAEAEDGYNLSSAVSTKFFVDNTEIITNKSNSNVVLSSGNASFISATDENDSENGELVALWNKHFVNGKKNGTISLRANVELTDTETLQVPAGVEAKLNLNGHVLSFMPASAYDAKSKTASAPIDIFGKLTIEDSSGYALTTPDGVRLSAVPDNTLATWDGVHAKYYVTKHESGELITYEYNDDLSHLGAIEYTSVGADPNGIIHVRDSGHLLLKSGRLTSPNARAILNGNNASDGASHAVTNIEGGYIIGCDAGEAGGFGSAILARNGSTTNIRGEAVIAGNSSVRDNAALCGTIWLNNSNTNSLNIEGGTITGNYSRRGGSAVFANGSLVEINISGGVITNNASGEGGAVNIGELHSNLRISNATITANRSENGNGAGINLMSLASPVLNISDSHVDGNIAGGQGGGIFAVSGIIAKNLCVSNNKAVSAGGIKTGAAGIDMSDEITVWNNKNNAGDASNLDLWSDTGVIKARITSALAKDSKIGVTAAEHSDKQTFKIVNTNIALSNQYTNYFIGDDGLHNIIVYNDGTNGEGMYIVSDDAELLPVNKGKIDISGPGNGGWIKIDGNKKYTIDQVYSPIASDANWSGGPGSYPDNMFSACFPSGVTLDELKRTLLYAEVGTIYGTNKSYWQSNNLNKHSGEYIIDIIFEEQAGSPNRYEIYFGTIKQEYRIHYLYPDFVTEGTKAVYIEKEVTGPFEGVIGQTVRVPMQELVAHNYIPTDSANSYSKTLVADAQQGGDNWYRKSETSTGEDGGATDSVNDLYVIVKKDVHTYKYDLQYVNADTNAVIRSETGLTWASDLPVTIKDEYKHLSNHDIVEATDVLQAGDFDENDIATRPLTIKVRPYPTYTISYIDAESGEKIANDETLRVKTGTTIDLTANTTSNNNRKNKAGYDFWFFVDNDTDDDFSERDGKITVKADSSSKIKLMFLKVQQNDYKIEFKDENGAVVKTITRKAKAGTTVSVLPDDYEFMVGSKKYRRVDGNKIEGKVQRQGEAQLVLSVNVKQIDYIQVRLDRHTYNGKQWTTSYEFVDVDQSMLDADGYFDLNADANKKYKEFSSQYIVLPAKPNGEDQVLRVFVGTEISNTPVIDIYYALVINAGAANVALQKTPHDNQLKPIERATTKDFLTMNLYDYSSSANYYYNSKSEQYPLFRWGKDARKSNSVSGGKIVGTFANIGLDGMGEMIFKDQEGANPTKSTVTVTANNYKDSLTGMQQVVNGTDNILCYYNGYVNSPLRTKTTKNGAAYFERDLVSKNLSDNDTPVINIPGQEPLDLQYLFPGDDTSQYCEKVNKENIDGLFDYDPNRGQYEYSSQKNHAEYNEETGNFDVYDAIITPNLLAYQFGNFLPFQKINSQATKSTQINSEYFKLQESYCRYKYQNATEGSYEYEAYKGLHDMLYYARTGLIPSGYTDEEKKKFRSDPKSGTVAWLASIGDGANATWDYKDMINAFWNKVQNQNTQQYAKDLWTQHPKDKTKSVNETAGGKTYDDLYMIDYDEEKDFHFGMDFAFDFVNSKNGQVSVKKTLEDGSVINTREDMVFEFEGDDDVWVYIDDMLFLNLSGIHRQVGGKINFAEGRVYYGDLYYGEPSAIKSATTQNRVAKNGVETGYIGYPSLDKNGNYIGHVENYDYSFREIISDAMQEAGYSPEKIEQWCRDNLTNNGTGTFKDWSQHSFKMFYLERGSGSGVMTINYNMPSVPPESILIGKNVVIDEEDSGSLNKDDILSDNEYYFQVLAPKPGATTASDELYIAANTPYRLYDGANYIDKVTDANGVITVRDGQFAVILCDNKNDPGQSLKESGDRYIVRELLDREELAQYKRISYTNYLSDSTDNGSYSFTAPSGEVELNITGESKKYVTFDSSPITIGDDKVALTSTVFDNVIEPNELGSIAIAKDIVQSVDEDGNITVVEKSDEKFKFAVLIDGYPIPVKNGNNQVKYYTYKKIIKDGKVAIDPTTGVSHDVTSEGIIEVGANEVAVLKHMLALSKYEIVEVGDDYDASHTQYHPIYMSNDGKNVYASNDSNWFSGEVHAGTHADENIIVDCAVRNQVAHNLIIKKDVIRDSSENVDYEFELDISYDNPYIDGVYSYDLFDIDDPIPTSASEIPSVAYVAEKAGADNVFGEMSAMSFLPQHYDTVEFSDHKATIRIPANMKAVIYGLPADATFTVTEKAEGYNTTFQGMNDSEAKAGQASSKYVLSVDDEADSTTELTFTNEKIEDLVISKVVEVNAAPLDDAIPEYRGTEHDHQFEFDIYVTLDNYPLEGTYTMTRDSADDDESAASGDNDSGADDVEEAESAPESIVFDNNGHATVTLAHNETVTIHGLPYGTKYTVMENAQEGYVVYNKTTADNFSALGILDPGFMGNRIQSDDSGLTDTQYARFKNSTVMVELPFAGNLGVMTLVFFGLVILMLVMNVVYRKARKKTTPQMLLQIQRKEREQRAKLKRKQERKEQHNHHHKD